MAMLLITRRIVPDAEAAVAHIMRIRPGVRLTLKQFNQLRTLSPQICN